MKRRIVLAGLPALMAFDWLARALAPESKLLDERWFANDPQSTTTINHERWSAFLDATLITDEAGINRFDYSAVSSELRASLDAYLAELQAVAVSSLNKREQLAFWINLYNAATVDVVLANYPVTSIRDIDFGRSFASGPWDEKILTIEGDKLSLNDIEHGIIRPVFNEPRIHYAVNCAAVGCPNLQRQPFMASELESQFDAAARAYVNDPRGVSFNQNGDLVVSSIFNWFAVDFGGSEKAILMHLKEHAEPPLRDRLAAAGGIDDYDYDWDLNNT